jgi:hypothetical protein
MKKLTNKNLHKLNITYETSPTVQDNKTDNKGACKETVDILSKQAVTA